MPLQPVRNLPAAHDDEQAMHTPFLPSAVALPAAYGALSYWPEEQEVTVAVAKPVLAVVLQTLVTYWLPAVGAEHVALGHAVALVPTLAPDAV